jgi:hypothetical protein
MLAQVFVMQNSHLRKTLVSPPFAKPESDPHNEYLLRGSFRIPHFEELNVLVLERLVCTPICRAFDDHGGSGSGTHDEQDKQSQLKTLSLMGKMLGR